MAVFGIVGAAGLADLVIQPLLKETYSAWTDWIIGLTALALSFLIGMTAVPYGSLTIFIGNSMLKNQLKKLNRTCSLGFSWSLPVITNSLLLTENSLKNCILDCQVF